MKLTCNIDSKGRVARLIYGVVLFVAGVVLMVAWARGTGSAVRWGVSAAVTAAGAFAIFEARAGWCVMRAMGFRTPM